MPIELPTAGGTRSPILRRRSLGESFTGSLVKTEQRQVIKDDKPVFKPNGKPQQELVVTMIAHPGATMNAGLGDDESIPEPGDIVRVILKGGGWSQWIDAEKALVDPATNRPAKRWVGDVVTLSSDYAQIYNADGSPSGGHITDQAAIDAARTRGKSVGIYGSVSIRRPVGGDAEWVKKAEDEFMAADRTELPATGGADPDDIYG